MKIFVSHSNDFDFEKELYAPLRESNLYKKHDFFFPHEGKEINTKEKIRGSDLVVAEVSLSGTGQGVELGWANAFNIPIVCFYKKGSKISGSLKYISNQVTEYTDPADLMSRLAIIPLLVRSY